MNTVKVLALNLHFLNESSQVAECRVSGPALALASCR